MRRTFLPLLLACAALSGCSGMEPILGPSPDDIQDQSQLSGASQALHFGSYANSEKIMGQYVYRADNGDLKLRYFGISSENRKQAIDTVVSLLWETGRDDTLKQFAGDYLSGNEYKTTLCRIAERQAQYEQAYHCWNNMGDVDRAERVIRTEAALRILGTQ